MTTFFTLGVSCGATVFSSLLLEPNLSAIDPNHLGIRTAKRGKKHAEMRMRSFVLSALSLRGGGGRTRPLGLALCMSLPRMRRF